MTRIERATATRAFRAEYWWLSLFSIICRIAGFAPTIAIVWLLMFVPMLGVFVRRKGWTCWHE